MEWITAILGILSFISSMSRGDGNRPAMESYVKPDLGPLNEQAAFVNYQDKTRNALLAEYYGGTLDSNGRVLATGRLPRKQYLDAQQGVLDESTQNFSPELAEYYASRGMDPGDQVQGAEADLNQTYDQRRREIDAKSKDIYSLTLGTLMGEVSDAGYQSAQIVGNMAQANAMENQRRDQSYQQAMSRWQYEQNKPNTAEAIGRLLPTLWAAYSQGGGGGGYDAGSAGSNAYVPLGYSQWSPPPSSYYNYGGS